MKKFVLAAFAALAFAVSSTASFAGPLECERLNVATVNDGKFITLVFPTKASGNTTINLRMDPQYARRGGDVRGAGACETPDVGKVVAYQIAIKEGKTVIPLILASGEVQMNVCITGGNNKRTCATGTWNPGDEAVEFTTQDKQKF